MFLKNLKIFTHKHCSNLALVGSQYIFQNSSIPIWALFTTCKQNHSDLKLFKLWNISIHVNIGQPCLWATQYFLAYNSKNISSYDLKFGKETNYIIQYVSSLNPKGTGGGEVFG